MTVMSTEILNDGAQPCIVASRCPDCVVTEVRRVCLALTVMLPALNACECIAQEDGDVLSGSDLLQQAIVNHSTVGLVGLNVPLGKA